MFSSFCLIFFLALYVLKEIYLVTVLDAFFFNVNFTLKRGFKKISQIGHSSFFLFLKKKKKTAHSFFGKSCRDNLSILFGLSANFLQCEVFILTVIFITPRPKPYRIFLGNKALQLHSFELILLSSQPW